MGTSILNTGNANVQDAFLKAPIKNTKLSAPGGRANNSFLTWQTDINTKFAPRLSYDVKF